MIKSCIFFLHLDEKVEVKADKPSASESSEGQAQSGQGMASPLPGVDFGAANPFDFSSMSNMLNVCVLYFHSIFVLPMVIGLLI